MFVPLFLFYFLWSWELNSELRSHWVSSLSLSYIPSQWDLTNIALLQKSFSLDMNHHMGYRQSSITNSPQPETWGDNHFRALGIWGLDGSPCGLVPNWLVGCLDFWCNWTADSWSGMASLTCGWHMGWQSSLALCLSFPCSLMLFTRWGTWQVCEASSGLELKLVRASLWQHFLAKPGHKAVQIQRVGKNSLFNRKMCEIPF